MGIDFNELKNKAEDLVEQHGDKIEQGVEKAGEFVKGKFGHAEQVDGVVDKIQDMIPDKPGTTEGTQA
ncbi:MAG TPA: antitoxin [Actinokineospora sp.]|nr:antitoxin [Actinokineospora sp.]